MKSATSIYFDPLANGGENPLPQEHLERLTLAHADAQVRSLAGKLSFRFQELARKASYSHFVERAVESADPDAGTAGVILALEQEFERASAALAAWNQSATVADRRARERSAEIAPLILRANNALINRENKITRLKMMLSDVRRNGLANSEKLKVYKAAGLTKVQISKLGDAGPTAFDVEQAEWEIKVLEGEVQRINAFIADPLHRLSQLQGLKLTDADDHTPGRFVPGPIHHAPNWR